MKDYDYVTLYMPKDSRTQRGPGSALISDECKEWLEANVGPGTLDIRTWMLNHDNDKFAWCYTGLDYSPESAFTTICRKFYIRDINKSLMFKLVWGG